MGECSSELGLMYSSLEGCRLGFSEGKGQSRSPNGLLIQSQYALVLGRMGAPTWSGSSRSSKGPELCCRRSYTTSLYTCNIETRGYYVAGY